MIGARKRRERTRDDTGLIPLLILDVEGDGQMPKYKAHKSLKGYYETVPKPSVEDIEAHYAEKYYQEAHGSYELTYGSSELTYFSNVAKVARTTVEKWGVERSLIDVGCGEGFFSQFFLDEGWAVSCCDFSSYGLEKNNPALMSCFQKGDIYETIKALSAEQKLYGIINLQNVLEHVLDPSELLKLLKQILSSKSILRITVPNDYSDFQMSLLEAGHTENTWFCPPEHLFYFNRETLTSLLQDYGYEILSLQADYPIEQFSVNPHANYARDKSLGKGAHKTRIFCQNYLIEKNIEHFITYCEAAAQLGFGRCLTAYVRLAAE